LLVTQTRAARVQENKVQTNVLTAGLTGGDAVPLANTAIAAKATAFTKMERADVLGAAGANLG